MSACLGGSDLFIRDRGTTGLLEPVTGVGG
jgi:hypothetical protein